MFAREDDRMADEVERCDHEGCKCARTEDSDYCSAYCETADDADVTAIACERGPRAARGGPAAARP
jgi:hypothetical protein